VAFKSVLLYTCRTQVRWSSTSRFEYEISQAYSPKKGPNSRKLLLRAMAKNRPNSGEDAFCQTTYLEGQFKGSVALSVADGVGGWAAKGVDASDFSHTLCENMVEHFQRSVDNQTLVSPLFLVQTSYDDIRNKGEIEAGGSTFCVGVASSLTGKFSTSNLGDSGYFIFRQGRLVGRSEPKTHSFNAPYQLSIIPEYILAEERRQAKRGRIEHIHDLPSDSDVARYDLRHGDVVIFATDGLTDNVFVHDILRLVISHMENTVSWYRDEDGELQCSANLSGADALAQNLVRLAYRNSVDPNYESPFSFSLRQSLATYALGGKTDDITVMVMLVHEKELE
jgi:protein phosphatase PTC7